MSDHDKEQVLNFPFDGKKADLRLDDIMINT